MCSRLRGGASRPARERTLVAVLPARSAIASPSARAAAWRGVEGAEDRDGHAGPAPWGVDGEVGGALQALDPGAVLAPFRQSGAPPLRFRGSERLGRLSLPASLVFVDPGPKLTRRQLRERQEQVAEVALRVDGNHRHAVDGGLFDERQAEPGLAAAGHPDADGVRDEVARIVEHRLVERAAGRHVVPASEIEEAELLEVLHRGMVAVNSARQTRVTRPRPPAPPTAPTAPTAPGTSAGGRRRGWRSRAWRSGRRGATAGVA